MLGHPTPAHTVVPFMPPLFHLRMELEKDLGDPTKPHIAAG